MSVYVSQRSISSAEFTASAFRLRKATVEFVSKFPTSYRYVITNNLLDLTTKIFDSCIAANDIQINQYLDCNDYDLRHRYLMLAKTANKTFGAEISFCYELINKGNNFFKNKMEYEKHIETIGNEYNMLAKLLYKLIASDKERWRKILANRNR